MTWYAVPIIPMLMLIQTWGKTNNQTSSAVKADDLASTVKLTKVRYRWKILCKVGLKFDYFPQIFK